MIGRRKTPPTNRQNDAAHPFAFGSPRTPRQFDQTMLTTLLFEPALGPWTIDELARDIGTSPNDVDDSVWRLHRTGVIDRSEEGFVWVSRAAAHTAALLDPQSKRASFT